MGGSVRRGNLTTKLLQSSTCPVVAVSGVVVGVVVVAVAHPWAPLNQLTGNSIHPAEYTKYKANFE